ncbi:MAG: thiol-activated cytolysin family protein [bacterium]
MHCLETAFTSGLRAPGSIIVSLAYISIILLAGCQKEPDYRTLINEHVESLPPISVEFPAEKTAAIDSTREEKDTEYVYTIDYYSVAAGYDEQIVLNPQTDAIYPGALIKGESVLDGSYVLIPAKRRPITISTSLTGSGDVSVTVDDPKLSTIRTAINNLMKQEYQVPPANLGFTMEQAYSEQQLKLSLRSSYNSGFVDVAGGFDYSNKKIRTRLVAKFIQSYYTLDMDMPSSPADLFEGEVNTTLFGTHMPMYVSTVTYGRMALFTIESELEETQVKAFLEGSYANIDASASSEFESLMASSTMKVYILGGSGADAVQTVDGFEAFKDYIKSGGNFSQENPGAPISYKLRYITDNTIGKIVFAANYPIRTAIPRTDNLVYDIKVRLYSFQTGVNDAGNACELRGKIESWRERDKAATLHNHFTGIDIGLNTTYTFPVSILTQHTLSDCLIEDKIKVCADMYEWDTSSGDDPFTKTTFEFPLIDIVSVLPGNEYYETADMEVREIGGSDWVKIKFRFYPAIRHIPD